jgi:hypothetical protein
MNKRMTLEEKIKEIQGKVDGSARVLAFQRAKTKASMYQYKVQIPYTIITQNDPFAIAQTLRIHTMQEVISLESLYASRPHHFVQIITDRAKLADQIEKCASVKEARKLLMDNYA